ncbi:MAG: hypothetical protein J0M29_08810 [Chitinophagales bacterium]|nr:hypothetical protein [Chitinophagales bacterium]
MRNYFIKILMICTLVTLMQCAGSKTAYFQQEQLPGLIDSLYQADQATLLIQPSDSAAVAYQRVIRSNFPAIEKIFRQFGFPGYALAGRKTSEQYFLLVQHSDFNPEFQLKVLKSMKKEVLKQNASGQNFAFLTDRVEINFGRPQIYGTQVIMGRNTQIKPCVDPNKLNERRHSIGLPTIEEYLEKCNEVFFMLNPNEKKD